MTLRETLRTFQKALLDAADTASQQATLVRDYQGGVAHGYFKGAELLGQWVLQGRFGPGHVLDQDIEES